MTGISPGRAAYEAYKAASDGRSLISGAALPAWNELRPEIREAWRAAADGAVMFASMRPSAEEDSGTPGYWQVRAALASTISALQAVALSPHGGIAAIAEDALANAGGIMDREPGTWPDALRLEHERDEARAVVVEMCAEFGTDHSVVPGRMEAGDCFRARVTQDQMKGWRERAGIREAQS